MNYDVILTLLLISIYIFFNKAKLCFLFENYFRNNNNFYKELIQVNYLFIKTHSDTIIAKRKYEKFISKSIEDLNDYNEYFYSNKLNYIKIQNNIGKFFLCMKPEFIDQTIYENLNILFSENYKEIYSIIFGQI